MFTLSLEERCSMSARSQGLARSLGFPGTGTLAGAAFSQLSGRRPTFLSNLVHPSLWSVDGSHPNWIASLFAPSVSMVQGFRHEK